MSVMIKETKHDQKTIRKHHSLMLFKMIKDFGPISRADLAKRSQMSATSASKIVKGLLEQGFVKEVGQTEGGVGRKATLVEINPEGVLIIGVNIDLESIQAGIVDLNGRILSSLTGNIELSRTPEEVLDAVVGLINELISKCERSDDRIFGIGVSVPGIVDWPDGKVAIIPQFHWEDVEVKAYLEKKLQKTVLVDNQVKTILLGESLYGSTVGVDNSVCIFVGSGVGGAVMNKGEVIRGNNNAFGEIGHVTVDPNGVLCDCGRFGCLQTFICSSALEKESGARIEDIFAAEKRGEAWAVRLIDRAAEYLAMTISNIACVYNPQVILLAGPMVDHNPDWVAVVEGKYRKYLWNPLATSFDIRYPSLGDRVGVVGSSCLVLKGILESPFVTTEYEVQEGDLIFAK
jgi:predicted NBD/HSP70 family sugar kinase